MIGLFHHGFDCDRRPSDQETIQQEGVSLTPSSCANFSASFLSPVFFTSRNACMVCLNLRLVQAREGQVPQTTTLHPHLPAAGDGACKKGRRRGGDKTLSRGVGGPWKEDQTPIDWYLVLCFCERYAVNPADITATPVFRPALKMRGGRNRLPLLLCTSLPNASPRAWLRDIAQSSVDVLSR